MGVVSGATGTNFTIPSGWDFIVWVDSSGNITSSNVTPGQVVQFKSDIIGGRAASGDYGYGYTCSQIGCVSQVTPVGDGHGTIAECEDNCCQNPETGDWSKPGDSCHPDCTLMNGGLTRTELCQRATNVDCPWTIDLCAYCEDGNPEPNCACASILPAIFDPTQLCHCDSNRNLGPNGLSACGGVCITAGRVHTPNDVTICECMNFSLISSVQNQMATCTCDPAKVVPCSEGKAPCAETEQDNPTCCLPLCTETAECGNTWHSCDLADLQQPLIPGDPLVGTGETNSGLLYEIPVWYGTILAGFVNGGYGMTQQECFDISNNAPLINGMPAWGTTIWCTNQNWPEPPPPPIV